MKIQKITTYKLYIDNGEIFQINPDIIYQYKLKKDMDISNIYNEVMYESAKQKAFFYIYLKSRTAYELKSKLKEKYKNAKVIEEVIEYMIENQYINDYDYALSYILTHKNSKRKNTIKLLQKGINKKTIDEVYLEINEDVEKESLQIEIEKLQKRNIDKSQIILKLMRKGYEYQKIKEMLYDF